MPGQVIEQCVLTRRERQSLLVAERLLRTGVEYQRAHPELVGERRARAAPDEGAQPRQQLAEVERLEEIVVCAIVEAGNTRTDGVTRRQDRIDAVMPASRSCRHSSRPSTSGSPRSRMTRIVVVVRRLLSRLASGARDIDGVGMFAQAFGEHTDGQRLVFHQEQSHAPILHRTGCNALLMRVH